MQEQKQWIFDQHKNTNHMYDTYLPYEFHLRMVYGIGLEHMSIIRQSLPPGMLREQRMQDVELALLGHDLIEDTRVTYNDVCEKLGKGAADIIYALTNEKGRNRAERANDAYYKGILDTPYAVFVKLCDRIANVQYSKMTRSRMFEMYKKENEYFMVKLGLWIPGYEMCAPLFEYLENLFEK
jgi:(p)ppGpp synthase/HD superfamily hydrolase